MASPSQEVRPLIPATEGRWWLDAQKDRRGDIIMAAAKKVWSQTEPARASMLSAWRLYSNQPLMGSGMQPRMYRRRALGTTAASSLSLNVVKSVCDTYVAMITKDEPAVMFQTKGGSATLQRKAQALEKFVAGIFHDAEFYETLPQVALDSALFPFGAIEVFEDWTDPKRPRVGIERRMAWEYVADEQDAQFGKPRSPYMIRAMDRLTAMATWPEKASEILERGAKVSEFDRSLVDDDGSGLTDQIVVITAWHLSSGKNDPGRKVICTGPVVMYDEPYDRQTTGVEWLYRLKPTTGIWSSSLAEELKAIQREINVLLNKLKWAHHITASGHWLVEQNSQLNTNVMDNQQGSIWRYKGVAPQFFPGGTVPPELYAHLDRLYQRAFEIIGVSQSTAQGQTPQLNGSGRAILAYADVQSQRFKPSYRQLQHFTLRVAREVIGTARRIADKHKAFAANAPGRMMTTVRWADANLEDEEFVMQPKAVNKLADDPVGVMDQVQNLANAGPAYMTPTAARRLMTEVPDLEAWASQMNAPYDLVMQQCDRMLEQGEYIAPDGFLPLSPPNGDGAIAWVHLRLLKAQLDGEDPENVDLLRRWLTEADRLDKEQKAASAPPAPPLPQGAALGPPPPAPVPPIPQAAAA